METASIWKPNAPDPRRQPVRTPNRVDARAPRSESAGRYNRHNDRVLERSGRSPRLPYKSVGLDLKRQYRFMLQAGAILALGLVTALFRMPMQLKSSFDVPVLVQEVVQMEDIQQTRQELKAPPPPRPPVPIEVPDDVFVADEELDLDVTLDFDEEIVVSTPPAIPEPKEERVEDEREIFVVVEEMPQIIGGTAKLYEYVVYPNIARLANLEGTVVVTFVVEPDGTTSEITVMKSVHESLDNVAVEAIRKIRFTPGKQRGRPVRVKMAIPIRFRLQ